MTHKPAASAIAAMIAAHIKAGVLEGIAADDLEYPKAPPVEAVRLGMYALVRLRCYDALASALLDGSGRPISRWWPVAYALPSRRTIRERGRRCSRCSNGEGTITRAFAARGLGVIKEHAAAAAPLVAIARQRSRGLGNVRTEAMRSLADLGAQRPTEPLANCRHR